MKADFTDVTVVLDRSVSMQSCKTDAEGGFNSFVDEQAKEAGECSLTLVEFDNEYNFVHRATPIKQVGKYTLVPRGSTALLDAVGRAINETGERLAAMPEEQRPGLVVFVIITDGQENASREFRREQIKEMIERQTKEYNWQFTFLGANQDAFAEAGNIGIVRQAAASYSNDNAQLAFAGASSNLKRMRGATSRGEKVLNSYTDAERDAMA